GDRLERRARHRRHQAGVRLEGGGGRQLARRAQEEHARRRPHVLVAQPAQEQLGAAAGRAERGEDRARPRAGEELPALLAVGRQLRGDPEVAQRGVQLHPAPGVRVDQEHALTGPAQARVAAFSSASMPGSGIPWTNSRDAPPPVDTRAIWSGRPAWLTAATLSPPPTTLRASRFCATARATASVPAANGGFSNTPIGPFQNTVRARATSSA